MKAVKTIFVYIIIAFVAELFVRTAFSEYKSLHHGIGITGGIPFKLNSYGLRDYEFDFDKKDKYRILCLGDSITFGTQNKLGDVYPEVLERLLNMEGKDRYHVINAGGVAGNTYFEYEYLKDKGIMFEPDYVILGLCLNDIGNCYNVEKEKNSSAKEPNFWERLDDFRAYKDSLKWNKDLPAAVNLQAQFNNLRWYLRANSYLFSFIEVNLLRFMYRSGMKKYSFGLYGEKEQLLAFGIDNTSEDAWKLVFGLLLDMRDFLSKRDIEFMIVVFPFEFQLSDDIKDNFFNIDRTKFTIDPQERLMDFGRDNGIEVLDMLPYFKKSSKKIYFPLDYCHPNANGHEIAAREIYNILTQNLN